MSDRALELFEQYLAQRASGQQPDAAALVHEAGDQAERPGRHDRGLRRHPSAPT